MGASNRYRRKAPMPLPVWIIDSWTGVAGQRDPRPGILVDWRQVTPDGCAPHWEGMVASVSGGGERGWTLEMKWIHVAELVPMDVHPPA